jgi:hypothetical protein
VSRVLTALASLLLLSVTPGSVFSGENDGKRSESVDVSWNFDKRLSDLEDKVDRLERQVASLTQQPVPTVYPVPSPFVSGPAGFTTGCSVLGCSTPAINVLPVDVRSIEYPVTIGTVRTITGVPSAVQFGATNCSSSGWGTQTRTGPVRRIFRR